VFEISTNNVISLCKAPVRQCWLQLGSARCSAEFLWAGVACRAARGASGGSGAGTPRSSENLECPRLSCPVLKERNSPESFRFRKSRVCSIKVHQLCETLCVYSARFRANLDYFQGPVCEFVSSLHGWCMHMCTYTTCLPVRAPRSSSVPAGMRG